jgi:DNA-binding NtrC family response regulator
MKSAAPKSTPTPPAKVLIVDDLEDARWVLTNLMRKAGFTPLVATNGEDALICFQQKSPDVVLLDVGLPDMNGFDVLARIKAQDKSVPVIMVTANGETSDAARSVRAGAWDYVTKPFKNEDVIHTVCRAFEDKALKSQARQILDSPQQTDSLLNSMGNSAVIQSIQREVERVAKTNFSVLVTGESGTGKELVSQAIHARSLQGVGKPFVAVDCGAISESLIESELFGHEKGAFTGAHQVKAGAFEMADGGTIFLDEIGNLPLAMQGKLLRVLETRRVHRIGSTNERKVNFRVVAATNAELLTMVDERIFRGDLYHRLSEYTIRLPALRERKEDLVFLVNRFLNQTNKELGKQVHGLSESAWGLIQRYDWPGNARELRNLLRRAVLLCDDPDGLITPDGLNMVNGRVSPPRRAESANTEHSCPVEGGAPACPFLGPAELLASGANLSLTELTHTLTARMERAILVHVLTLTHGNKAQAARMLQVDYKTIHSKLKTHEISSVGYAKNPFVAAGG